MNKKALWKRTLDAKQPPAPKPRRFSASFPRRKPVRPQSLRRAKQMREYRAKRRLFLAIHHTCLVCAMIPQVAYIPNVMQLRSHHTTEIHHQRGKIGPLLLDERYWTATCRDAHNWIRDNVPAARELGLIGPVGSWNGSKSIRE